MFNRYRKTISLYDKIACVLFYYNAFSIRRQHDFPASYVPFLQGSALIALPIVLYGACSICGTIIAVSISINSG